MPLNNFAFSGDYTNSTEFPNPQDGGPSMRSQVMQLHNDTENWINSYLIPLVNADEKRGPLVVTVDTVNTTANAIVGTVSPTPTTLDDLVNVPLILKTTLANTAAVTLNLNNTGAKSVTNLYPNDAPIGSILLIVYDGTNYRLLNSLGAYSEMKFVTHDLSVTGVQTITGLAGLPRRIEIKATINGGSFLSIGSWEAGNNAQSVSTFYRSSAGSPQAGSSNTIGVSCPVDQANSNNGTIQNVQNGQFDISWAKSGAPTGTANLQITVHYR